MAAPLIVGAMATATITSVFKWTIWRELSHPSSSIPPADIFLRMIKLEFWLSLFALASTVTAIYVLAGLRWGYHYSVITVLRKWYPCFERPPLVYFVISTAAWVCWLNIYLAGMVFLLWRWDGESDVAEWINAMFVSNANVIVLTLIFIAAVLKLASRASRIGMSELYGHSNWISLIVTLTPALLMMGFLVVFGDQYK
ncbi:hypothetical protein [Pseudomonas sichuanensis]|uniref:hypothetical protein n=1 Tax=Pseudomonas sichuanensis TaxID=2213015 RepID=UPI0036EBB4F9